MSGVKAILNPLLIEQKSIFKMKFQSNRGPLFMKVEKIGLHDLF
jgi:hypothetical protein